MGWNHSITLGDAAPLFAAIASALALALTFLLGIWRWISRRQRRNPGPLVDARVEAIRSLNVEGSYRAIRIILRNLGETKTTVEEIILCRRPGWFEFGILGPLVRLSGLLPWRFNAGFASRKTVALPVTIDVNGLWESFIPLEPADPANQEEIRQFERLRFDEAAKILRSGGMRYSIQLSCPTRVLAGSVNMSSY